MAIWGKLMITPPKKTYKIPTSYTSSQMLEKNGNITWWGGTYAQKKWGKVVVKKKKEKKKKIGKGICLCAV